jgi:hypothetical protein
MTFPVYIFSGRLALLISQLLLLLFDPGQFRNREDADSVEAHTPGRGYSDPPSRRMYAKVDVLDVLSNNVQRNVTELNLRLHQYSG